MFENLRDYRTGPGSRINADYLASETDVIRELKVRAESSAAARARVAETAAELVRIMRRDRAEKSGLDAFLLEYDLSSAEGVALMCLAEALLRVPDADTADALIADRLSAGDWGRHFGESDSVFVNASTWGLMLTGRLMPADAGAIRNPVDFIRSLIGRLGEPVVRAALNQAMRIMSGQFVMGRDIAEALERSREPGNKAYRYSFDMLGEAAMTAADGRRYFEAYRHAIECIGAAGPAADISGAPGVSIKLSALSPRLEPAQLARVIGEVVPRLTDLAATARSHGVAVTVDAEETARLELTLEVFRRTLADPRLDGWSGLGIAVQAYQRRAARVIGWLAELAAAAGRSIPVRLVKGAYWDTEIKQAQELGLADYPVFTRKLNTDIAYLACARLLFESPGLAPQFATHNAHTVAWVLHNAPAGARFEYQRLHGMGQALYDAIIADARYDAACRVYAPVGCHEDLLPYLVRRLLENGANTSFVNRIVQEDAPVDDLIGDPVEDLAGLAEIPNPAIPGPPGMFGSVRDNSAGVNLADGRVLAVLARDMDAALAGPRTAGPVVSGHRLAGEPHEVVSPADRGRVLGTVEWADAGQVGQAINAASVAFPEWRDRAAGERAGILRAAADLFENNQPELVALCVAEAGKTVRAAVSEVREAVDFMRYYAAEAERLMSAPQVMPGPTGETNELFLAGRGVFVCISPWNFPLAIFTGQVAAALAAGNAVLAKPAEQTALVAARAVELLHAAGVPGKVLHFLPGTGDVGAAAVSDARVAGVGFTGSTVTAQSINRALAGRDGPIGVLIAETGGQNAMIADSTALLEQLVRDVVVSAFDSAGQRCSALRVLLLQEDIADAALEMLAGHMAELEVGDPVRFQTDVGPVIDEAARDALVEHRAEMLQQGRLVAECRLPPGLAAGHYVAPIAIEISDISILKEEHFGPILHIVRFAADELDGLLDAIGATGFGLTLGLQSRIERRFRTIGERAPAGNVYINRNMIGAVVGVQPFGGMGLSGTGPKAGGPHYLPRFMTERTVTVNTAAIGGNAALLAGRHSPPADRN